MDFGGGPEGRSDLRPRTVFWFWDVRFFTPRWVFLTALGYSSVCYLPNLIEKIPVRAIGPDVDRRPI